VTDRVSFVVGANLPWLRYGGDFGANAWSPRGGLASRGRDAALDERLHLLRARGVEVLRWFVLCDGRAGLRVGSDGMPAGLDDFVLRDFESALEYVGRAGLRILPVLLDFHWCHPARVVNGVQIGGRRAMLARPDWRAALVDRVIAPLAGRFGHDPRIYAWDVINEPEWVTFDLGTWRPWSTLRISALRAYITLAADRLHALGRHPVTVGSASARYLPAVQGLGLDFYQPHWYDRFERRHPIATPVASLACDAPVMLGEFPTSGSEKSPAALIATAHAAGYSGAMFWSVMAEDDATDFENAQSGLDEWTRVPDDASGA
jgi:hypothetical protein